MDILLQSDGQLHPQRRSAPKPPPKKEPAKELCPPPAPCAPAEKRPLPLEELLLIGVAVLLLRSSEQPDLPLLLALAYILLDRDFSLKGLL
ncbi:MAG: hypothetical protein IJC46_03155 [Clostridia bacterium]|nr:hypothetical protein [Clostridia bacterium]